MNKDVIYIEPEDDITDIITKIENSTERIAVLVPPKKASVLRSVVNIKLIAKAGAAADKTVVLVTVDPSIIKLAAASHLLVTKDLKTPPAVPHVDAEIDDTETDIIADEYDESDTNAESAKGGDDDEFDDKDDESLTADEKETDADEDAEIDDDSDAKPAAEEPMGKFARMKEWILDHKIVIVGAVLALVALIAFLIWAFVFAPAVTVNVDIQTWGKGFAESVNFTTKREEENAAEGKFLLGEKKVETIKEMKFSATGKKNLGEHAKGQTEVYTYFKGTESRVVKNGSTINVDGMTYVVEEGTTLSWDSTSTCANQGSNTMALYGCQIIGTVTIAAADAGTKYNSEWLAGDNVEIDAPYVYVGAGEADGGTDREVTVVEQIDIEKAKDQLKVENEDEIKQKLYEQIGNGVIKIESSFAVNIGNAESSPAVGEEVKDGVTPTLKIVTTATMLVVDQAKIEEYISAKTALSEGQRIYEIKSPYIENFVKDGETYTGRLKANCNIGPSVTESQVLDIVRGKGLGDVQHELKNIGGIVGVTIDTSYPWVNVAPNDSNKITINLNVREQNQTTSTDNTTKGNQ